MNNTPIYIKLDKSGKTLYNSSNASNNYQINISHSSQKNENYPSTKNTNISLIAFKFLALLYAYLCLCNRENNDKNEYSNNNKKMKHAILILSSYGISYLNNVLSQFNNDKRFDIYIHIDRESKIDIKKNKKLTKSKIKFIKHIFKSKKYSTEMVDVMLKLLIIANKKDNYDYFHYFSDSCYLIKTLDDFYQFFFQNNNKSYMEYFLSEYFLYKNQSFILYKGSQWMSLHNNIVHKLLDNINLFYKYKEAIRNKTIKIIYGAPDEFIFQHIIVNDICKREPQKYNIINSNLRFIRWNYNELYCPNYLDIDNVSKEEIKTIKKNNYLIIRKINYTNFKAIDLVNRLKGE